MAPRKTPRTDITAESLQLEVPANEGINVGGFLPADGTETELKPTDVISDEVHEAPAKWTDRAKAVRAAANAKPDGDESEPEHVSIGIWEAVYWKSRPMWRHKRTGQTLFKRDEVNRLRNLK